jgi:drug/metabolite transporter (DMT)-like permease
MKKSQLSLTVFMMIVMTDAVESIAEVFMKKGLLLAQISTVGLENLGEVIPKVIFSPLVWLGILLYVANFFIWITVLSRVELSVAFPVGSTCYIFVPLLAIFFLHEQVGPLRWLGILLIILGIHFVSQSGQEKQKI